MPFESIIFVLSFFPMVKVSKKLQGLDLTLLTFHEASTHTAQTLSPEEDDPDPEWD